MDFAIDIDDSTGYSRMTFEQAGTLLNNIWLSLTVQRGSFFYRPDFGSRLHLLHRAKLTPSTINLAEGYCREALQWLIDSGKASGISVTALRDTTESMFRLKLLVEVTPGAGADPVAFTTFIPVV